MITYLLGAGASADCIPIVSKFIKTYESIINIELLKGGNPFKGYTGLRDNFRDNFSSYFSTIKPHPTIDIYAKKLFLKKDYRCLNQLKKWLIVFFNLLQYSRPIDERYTKFFASILTTKENNNVPGDINILTWNYDMQLELAFSDFVSEERQSIDNIHNLLRVYPSPYYDFKNHDENDKIYHHTIKWFCIYGV